jgi:Fur family transcriptional regulator, peroxide stress response regulator
MIIHRVENSNTVMNTNLHFESMVEELKAHGHRLTPQRLEIVKLLAYATDHPSAAQLYERITHQFPTTSLATVYKTLTILKELNLVQEMGFSQDDNRYDASASRAHAHLICVRCRRIVDAEAEPLPNLADHVAERSGYRLVSQRVEFYGLCPECQSEA